jgi:hypothetical protein
MSESESDTVFSSDEARVLSAVLDEIVPARAGGPLPGAGALGLIARIENAVRASPDLRPAITQGLAALEERTRGRGAASFAELDRDARLEVLNEISSAAPAFLPALIFQTYVGYYEHPRVMEALGLEGRPPHPKGYAMEPGDLSLLDPVRARPKMYREG